MLFFVFVSSSSGRCADIAISAQTRSSLGQLPEKQPLKVCMLMCLSIIETVPIHCALIDQSSSGTETHVVLCHVIIVIEWRR